MTSGRTVPFQAATSAKALAVPGVTCILDFAATLVAASPVMTHPATNLIALNARGVTGSPFLKSRYVESLNAPNCTSYLEVLPPIQFDLLLFQTEVSTGDKTLPLDSSQSTCILCLNSNQRHFLFEEASTSLN